MISRGHRAIAQDKVATRCDSCAVTGNRCRRQFIQRINGDVLGCSRSQCPAGKADLLAMHVQVTAHGDGLACANVQGHIAARRRCGCCRANHHRRQTGANMIKVGGSQIQRRR